MAFISGGGNERLFVLNPTDKACSFSHSCRGKELDVFLNGQPYSLDGSMPLSELLTEAGYSPDRVAVILKGRVVPRTDWETTLVGADDCLEVVAFVGGG
jgi:thiamine biosynthesis protein ThiS